MDSPIHKTDSSFIQSPFEDPFFAQLAAYHGYEDDGREWEMGIPGYRSEDDPAVPKSMPYFGFTRGREKYEGGLHISFEHPNGRIGYMHTANSIPHFALDDDKAPNAFWESLVGQPLSRLVDIKGMEGWQITIVHRRPQTGITFRDIAIEPVLG